MIVISDDTIIAFFYLCALVGTLTIGLCGMLSYMYCKYYTTKNLLTHYDSIVYKYFNRGMILVDDVNRNVNNYAMNYSTMSGYGSIFSSFPKVIDSIGRAVFKMQENYTKENIVRQATTFMAQIFDACMNLSKQVQPLDFHIPYTPIVDRDIKPEFTTFDTSKFDTSKFDLTHPTWLGLDPNPNSKRKSKPNRNVKFTVPVPTPAPAYIQPQENSISQYFMNYVTDNADKVLPIVNSVISSGKNNDAIKVVTDLMSQYITSNMAPPVVAPIKPTTFGTPIQVPVPKIISCNTSCNTSCNEWDASEAKSKIDANSWQTDLFPIEYSVLDEMRKHIASKPEFLETELKLRSFFQKIYSKRHVDVTFFDQPCFDFLSEQLRTDFRASLTKYMDKVEIDADAKEQRHLETLIQSIGCGIDDVRDSVRPVMVDDDSTGDEWK
jgi:hypothetical protein